MVTSRRHKNNKNIRTKLLSNEEAAGNTYYTLKLNTPDSVYHALPVDDSGEEHTLTVTEVKTLRRVVHKARKRKYTRGSKAPRKSKSPIVVKIRIPFTKYTNIRRTAKVSLSTFITTKLSNLGRLLNYGGTLPPTNHGGTLVYNNHTRISTISYPPVLPKNYVLNAHNLNKDMIINLLGNKTYESTKRNRADMVRLVLSVFKNHPVRSIKVTPSLLNKYNISSELSLMEQQQRLARFIMTQRIETYGPTPPQLVPFYNVYNQAQGGQRNLYTVMMQPQLSSRYNRIIYWIKVFGGQTEFHKDWGLPICVTYSELLVFKFKRLLMSAMIHQNPHLAKKLFLYLACSDSGRDIGAYISNATQNWFSDNWDTMEPLLAINSELMRSREKLTNYRELKKGEFREWAGTTPPTSSWYVSTMKSRLYELFEFYKQDPVKHTPVLSQIALACPNVIDTTAYNILVGGMKGSTVTKANANAKSFLDVCQQVLFNTHLKFTCWYDVIINLRGKNMSKQKIMNHIHKYSMGHHPLEHLYHTNMPITIQQLRHCILFFSHLSILPPNSINRVVVHDYPGQTIGHVTITNDPEVSNLSKYPEPYKLVGHDIEVHPNNHPAALRIAKNKSKQSQGVRKPRKMLRCDHCDHRIPYCKEHHNITGHCTLSSTYEPPNPESVAECAYQQLQELAEDLSTGGDDVLEMVAHANTKGERQNLIHSLVGGARATRMNKCALEAYYRDAFDVDTYDISSWPLDQQEDYRNDRLLPTDVFTNREFGSVVIATLLYHDEPLFILHDVHTVTPESRIILLHNHHYTDIYLDPLPFGIQINDAYFVYASDIGLYNEGLAIQKTVVHGCAHLAGEPVACIPLGYIELIGSRYPSLSRMESAQLCTPSQNQLTSRHQAVPGDAGFIITIQGAIRHDLHLELDDVQMDCDDQRSHHSCNSETTGNANRTSDVTNTETEIEEPPPPNSPTQIPPCDSTCPAVAEDFGVLTPTPSESQPPTIPHTPMPTVGGYSCDTTTFLITGGSGPSQTFTSELELRTIVYSAREWRFLQRIIYSYRHVFVTIWPDLNIDNPFYMMHSNSRELAISSRLYKHLVSTKMAASLTETSVRSVLHLALNWNTVALPNNVAYSTCLYFLHIWSGLNAQYKSITDVYIKSAKYTASREVLNLDGMQDYEILQQGQHEDGVYGQLCNKPMRLYYRASGPIDGTCNDNWKVIKANNVAITKSKDGTLTSFAGFTKDVTLPTFTQYASAMCAFVTNSVTLEHNASETAKAVFRLINDNDGHYTEYRLKHQLFFGLPESLQECANVGLEINGPTAEHPVARLYYELFNTTDNSTQFEDFVNEMQEYITKLGVKLDERYKALHDYLLSYSEVPPDEPHEAGFKKHETAKIKIKVSPDGRKHAVVKYGRLFIAMPGLKWLLTKPHWVSAMKEDLCQYIYCDGHTVTKYNMAHEPTVIAITMRPFLHCAVLYPVVGGDIQVNQQHLGLVMATCLEFVQTHKTCQASVSHGDDMVTIRYNGTSAKFEYEYNNVDISNCDATHTSCVMGFCGALMRKVNKYSMAAMLGFTQRIRVRFPGQPRDQLVIKPKYGYMPSGHVYTTLLNSMVSSCICIAYSQGCEQAIGYTTTNEVRNCLEGATFLAHYFYAEANGTIQATIDMATIFRGYGRVAGDVRKTAKTVVESFDNHCKGVIAGYKHHPGSILLNAFRRRHGLVEPPITINNTISTLRRLQLVEPLLTEDDLHLLAKQIHNLSPGQFIVSRIVDAWCNLRYAYPPISASARHPDVVTYTPTQPDTTPITSVVHPVMVPVVQRVKPTLGPHYSLLDVLGRSWRATTKAIGRHHVTPEAPVYI